MIEELPIMPVKVTKKQFIEAIENNEEGLTNLELATKLGISEQYFYDLKKKYKDELKDAAREILLKNAVELARHLLAQSKAGKTEATKTGLEIIEIYKSNLNLNLTNKIQEEINKKRQEAEELVKQIEEDINNNADSNVQD